MVSTEPRLDTKVGGSVAEWSKALFVGNRHFDCAAMATARFCLIQKVNACRLPRLSLIIRRIAVLQVNFGLRVTPLNLCGTFVLHW